MNVTGGSPIQVNSNNAAAANVTGSSKITDTGGAINVVGGAAKSGTASYSTPLITGAPVLVDPLKSLQTPADRGLTTGLPTKAAVSTSSTQTANLSSGIYPSIKAANASVINMAAGNYIIQGALTVTGDATLNLGAGVYVIEGPFTVDSGGKVNGTGVTFYFTCSGYPAQVNDSSCASPGTAGGYFSQSGGGGTIVKAPTAPANDPYTGLLMFYDRNNTGATCSTGFVTNGSTTGFQATGTIYAADANLCLRGGALTLDTLFVVNELQLANSATVNAYAIPSEQVTLPGASAPGKSALIG